MKLCCLGVTPTILGMLIVVMVCFQGAIVFLVIISLGFVPKMYLKMCHITCGIFQLNFRHTYSFSFIFSSVQMSCVSTLQSFSFKGSNFFFPWQHSMILRPFSGGADQCEEQVSPDQKTLRCLLTGFNYAPHCFNHLFFAK